MRLLAGVIGFLALVLPEMRHANAGKTATKSGLVNAAKTSKPGKDDKTDSVVKTATRERGTYSPLNITKTPIQQLKSDLMDGYDTTMAPILDYEHNVNIQVGFTYRQVLDLDEKNQVLKSLIWFRMVWKDIHFVWDPEDYGGLEDIEIPYSLVWMPDIVVYEEIGTRTYAPRLSHVKVKHDGTVQYQEPTSIETSCSIDTAYFPFDVQTCGMTYVSWSQPITRIDLSSDRESWKLARDTKDYFINTGEWKLARINVKKVVRDYGALIEGKAALNQTIDNATTPSPTSPTDPTSPTSPTEAPMFSSKLENIMESPTQHVGTMLPGNYSITDSMYSEVVFTMVVRRNSSLYMQSMLFPSIILTTVALLGFYLPPESGERIGLQITILLTFMVFLLAVGEMFPASTGPYLGVYFVICMGLLGVNLAMTVMVLHIHFKPVVNKSEKKKEFKKTSKKTRMKRCAVSCCDTDTSDDEVKCEKKRKRKKRNASAIPRRCRIFLQFCDNYWTLGERGSRWMRPVTDDEYDDIPGDDVNSGDESNSNECTWSDSRDQSTAVQESPVDLPEVRVSKGSNSTVTDVQYVSETGQRLIQDRPKSASAVNLSVTKPSQNEKNGIEKGKSTGYLPPDANEDSTPSAASIFRLTNAPKLGDNYETKSDTERSNVLRHRVLNALQEMKGVMAKTDPNRKGKWNLKKKTKKKSKKQDAEKKRQREREEEQERQDLEQEEWKSVARAVDIIFFRIYVIFIVFSHVGLLGAVYASWNAEDHT